MRLLQLGHELRGEVAPLVEIVDQAVARRHRRIDRGARARGGTLQGHHGAALLLELVERSALRSQRPPMRFHAHAIELGDRRHPARHAADRAQIIGGEQELDIAGTAALR